MLEITGALILAGLFFLIWYRITKWIAGEFSRARGVKALGWFLLLLFTLSFLFHSNSYSYAANNSNDNYGGDDDYDEDNSFDWWNQEEEDSYSSSYNEDDYSSSWDDDGD